MFGLYFIRFGIMSTATQQQQHNVHIKCSATLQHAAENTTIPTIIYLVSIKFVCTLVSSYKIMSNPITGSAVALHCCKAHAKIITRVIRHSNMKATHVCKSRRFSERDHVSTRPLSGEHQQLPHRSLNPLSLHNLSIITCNQLNKMSLIRQAILHCTLPNTPRTQ